MIWAKNSPVKDRLGATNTLSANTAYNKINSILMLIGAPLIDSAPTVFGESLAIVVDQAGLSISAADQQLHITAAANLRGWDSLTVGDKVLFFISGPQSPNKNFFAGPYRYANFLEGATVPITFPADIDLPSPVALDQKVLVA